MKSAFSGLAATALLGLAAAAMPTAATAANYSFMQGGYADGAMVSGTFTGVDLDSDGMLASFLSEITGFTLSFSGNTAVAAFTHQFSDLYGLAYQVGGTTLGGVTGGLVDEGIASNFFGFSGFEYLTGIGPTGGVGGRITDIATGVTTTSAQLVQVQRVPEPGTAALVLCSLAAVGWHLRRRGAAGRTQA